MSGGTNVLGDKCLGGQMPGGQLIWTWSLPTTMTRCRVGRDRGINCQDSISYDKTVSLSLALVLVITPPLPLIVVRNQLMAIFGYYRVLFGCVCSSIINSVCNSVGHN